MKEHHRSTEFSSALTVLLYIPNIIDYLRLILLVLSWLLYYCCPWTSLCTYVLSIALDAVDGIVARRLKQTSAFGAWLDIVVDNLGRGMLWCRLCDFGFCVTALEWLTFVCTHTYGSEWKSRLTGPRFVQAVMDNNFRSPLGFLAVGSLNVLPIWLYCLHFGLLSELHIPVILQYLVLLTAIIGRMFCAAVEIWVVYVHVLFLCSETKKTSS